MRAVALMFAAVLLYGPPTTFEVTSTVITHEACAALIVAPVTVMVPRPRGGGDRARSRRTRRRDVRRAATTTLAGSVSVKLMPDCAGLPAPLVSVKVSVDVPPTSIAVGANALLSEACTTVSVWLVTPLVSTPPTVTLPAPFT